MLDKDDPLYTAKKALKATKKAAMAAEKSFEALKKFEDSRRKEPNDFYIRMQKMLQNSRTNIEKMKEISRQLNNIS